MDIISDLNHEHKHIVRMLNIIDHTAEHIESGRPVPVEIINDELNFIRGFTDKCHHGKEEHILFQMLESKLDADMKETMNRLISDHIEGRKLTKKANEHLNKAAEGDKNAAVLLAETLKNFTGLLRDHIKTESVFFHDTRPLLSEHESVRLSRACEKMEEELGGHEQFLEMLDRLEGSNILRKRWS